MSVKAYWYTQFFKQIWQDSPTYGGWKPTGGDSFKIMLVGTAYVPNQDTHAVKNDVIGEVVGQGYNAGGQVLTSKTISVATGSLVLGADPVTWTNCIFQTRRAVIYDDTNASVLQKQLVRFVDFQQLIELNNQTLMLRFDGLGNVDIEVSPPPPPQDTDPPRVSSATINTSTLTITFDENLDTTSTPAASSFVVRVNGTAQASPSAVVVGTTTVTLTTAAPVTGGQTVALDYNAPAVNQIKDVQGNDALSFLNLTVQNTTVTPLVDNAAFVSQTVPQTMTTATPYAVTVVMNNNGTTSWIADQYLLLSANPFNNNTWGIVTVPLPQIVLPGANCVFSFDIQAPSLAGVYNFQWSMYSSATGGGFGSLSTNVVVTVSDPVPPPTPTFILQVPNGGEDWVIGSSPQQVVRWVSSNLSPSSTLRHELSRDGGSTWTTIYTGSFNDGAAPWTPTAPATTQARWKITSELNSVATDISDAVFTISDPPTPPPPEPTAPVLSSFTAINSTTLTWVNTNVADETGYEYETASSSSGPWTIRGARGVDNTTFTWTTANPSTSYFARVSSIGPSLTRYPSNVLLAATPAPPPPEPVAPVLSSVSAPTSNSIVWNNTNVANETGYTYESGPAAIGPWTLRGTRPADTVTFTWEGATPSTTYHMRVSSIGASGTEYPSNVLSVTTPATPPDPPPPEPVAPVLGSVSAPTTTSLVWNHNNVSDELGYEYFTSPTGLGTWTLRGTNPANSTSFTWNAASPSTTYDMRVSSFGAAGTRYPSNTLTVTTPTPPPPEPVAPVLSTLTAPVSTSLTWTHTNVADETGYEYSTSPNGTSSWTVRGTAAAGSTTFTWTTATPNTLYFARVASIGSSGTRYQSNVLSATTPPTPAATLTVVAPNGSENWLVGSVQTLRWSSANLGADTIKVELSRDGGSTHETLFPSLNNDGSENWTVTQPTGVLNRLRISGVTNTGVTDSSNANFTISVQSSGNVRFVSITGSDTSGTGTETNPWRTIRKGLTSGQITAGSTLYCRGGNYGERVRSDIYTMPVGTSFTNAVTVSAYQNEPVVIRNIGMTHSYVQYMIFSGLTIDGASVENECVYLAQGTNHIRILNCEIKNSLHSGVFFPHVGSDSQEIIGCSVHHNGSDSINNVPQDHGFYIASRNNLVEDCDCYSNFGYGMQIYNGYAGERADNNIIRLCRVHHNGTGGGAAGLAAAAGTGNLIYNNLVYSNPRGIDVAWKSPTNTGVYFNTVYGNTGGIVINSDSTGAIVRNNIVYQASGITTTGSVGTTVDHNISGGTNPMFVNATNGNFHLLAGSPAIGNGIAVTGITTDFDGVTRGNPPDIGAYEFV